MTTPSVKHCVTLLALGLLWLVAPAAPGAAGETARPAYPQTDVQTTRVIPPPAAGRVDTGAETSAMQKFEEQPILFQGDARRAARPEQPRGASLSFPSLLPILFFVLVVCGLFVGGLYLVKKYLPGHRQLFSHPAMEVLGRTHLDQRRYVSLLRVGKRIIVVGVSQDEMRPLGEITDEEEITGIMEVARPKSEQGLTIFQRLFQRNVIDNEKAEARAMAVAKAEELTEQMSSLRDRVRAIRESEEPARRLDAIG